MSANPIRFAGRSTVPDQGSPLQEGNRVLESIARQEALRALLAFSDLHERIRNRRMASGGASDRDLFETERFILDEVLQLICDRAEAITETDGIVIALAEGQDIVCRAASGELAVARGVQLITESELLQQCLESGRILRCDDCETDARAELDFARVINARSTVLVPLRGRRQQLGVMQAFSTSVRAFSDHHVRCFDLFAELVLSALKPDDQNRRVDWLSNVAGEVLRAKPASVTANHTVAEVQTTKVVAAHPPQHAASPLIEPPVVKAWPSRIPDVEVGAPRDPDFDIEPPSLAFTEPDPIITTLSLSDHSRAGLRRVLSLMVIAASLSAATWWGLKVKSIRIREQAISAKVAEAMRSVSPRPRGHRVTAAAGQPTHHVASSVPDDLMSRSSTAANEATLILGGQAAPSKVAVTGVRHWSSADGSTVVIDMEDEVPYEVHRLASPERIYFDLHSTALPAELEGKTMDVGDAELSRVRIGQPVAGITRVVLDTEDGTNFSVSMESSPYRLVVKLQGAGKTLAIGRTTPKPEISNQLSASIEAALTPAKAVPLTPLPSKTPTQLLPAKTGRFRIVLDAGHGGWDLGTVGRHGLLEKDLVLDVTERLGKLLQSRLGSEILFTRSDDTYLPLDQRADIANQVQADLFISVHANYSSSTSARGIETYYTNMFSAPGARENEKHEDGSSVKLSPVSLSVDGLREKIDESRRLAASVQRSLYSTLAANSPDIRNRGIKDAAFVVLTGTTMPAILTEISFVSSPEDEHNLQSPAYRQQVAEALYQGIARYEQASPRAKIAQLQTSSADKGSR